MLINSYENEIGVCMSDSLIESAQTTITQEIRVTITTNIIELCLDKRRYS